MEKLVFFGLWSAVAMGVVAFLVSFIYNLGASNAWKLHVPRTLPQRRPLEVLAVVQIQGEWRALLRDVKTEKERYWLNLGALLDDYPKDGDILQAFESTAHKFEIRITGRKTLDGIEELEGIWPNASRSSTV